MKFIVNMKDSKYIFLVVFLIFLFSCKSNGQNIIVQEVVVTATPINIPNKTFIEPTNTATPINIPNKTFIEPTNTATPINIPNKTFVKPTITATPLIIERAKISERNLREISVLEDDLKLSFNVPATWNKEKNKPNEISYFGKEGNIFIKKIIYQEEINSSEEFYDFAENETWKINPSEFTKTITQYGEYKDISTIKITGSLGIAQRENIFFSVSNNYTILIALTWNPDYLSEYDLIFDRLLESLEFMENSNPSTHNLIVNTPTVSPTPENKSTFQFYEFYDSGIDISLNVPVEWDQIKDSSSLFFRHNHGNFRIENFPESNNSLYIFSQNYLGASNLKEYIENSFEILPDKLISEGYHIRPYKRFVFFVNGKGQNSVIIFSCNPDFIQEYLSVFDEIQNSIKSDFGK